MRKKISLLLLLLMSCSLYLPESAFAYTLNDIVINEVNWAGSDSNSNDEWIELKNNLATDVNLNGFQLFDDGNAIYQFSSEVILANSYFLIEKKEDVTSVPSDVIISNLSLANTGDTIILKDNAGVDIDIVNSAGGQWFAGSNTSKATMARIDSAISGDLPTNWTDTTNSSGSTDSGGVQIMGTPKADNNITEIVNQGSYLSLTYSGQSASLGMDISINLNYLGESGIFSYGVELEFDPTIVSYKGATESLLLSEEGDIETSFESGLVFGEPNKLLIGGARLMENKQDLVNAQGSLATLEFEVIGNSKEKIDFQFNSHSFISNIAGDIDVSFNNLSIPLLASSLAPVTNVISSMGQERYSFLISWDPEPLAQKYIVELKDYNGNFSQIAEISNTTYTYDQNVVPQFNYVFRISAKAGTMISQGTETTVQETRGIQGDFDRSDRVDGRDLSFLASSWGYNSTHADYKPLADLNRDGLINSLDLFHVGGNWGNKYM